MCNNIFDMGSEDNYLSCNAQSYDCNCTSDMSIRKSIHRGKRKIILPTIYKANVSSDVSVFFNKNH